MFCRNISNLVIVSPLTNTRMPPLATQPGGPERAIHERVRDIGGSVSEFASPLFLNVRGDKTVIPICIEYTLCKQYCSLHTHLCLARFTCPPAR